MNLEKKRKKLIKKLTNKEYRDAWAAESIKMVLPYQIQANRTIREWSQEILGQRADMKQNAITRLENPNYGNLNINTLLRLASAFDCGLLVKFVPFSRMVKEFEDVSPLALEVQSFEEEDLSILTKSNENDDGNTLYSTPAIATPIGEYEAFEIQNDLIFSEAIA